MAFDATVGGADSNSYVTVAQADDYFETRARSDKWDALASDAIKQQYLVTATSQLEKYVTWYGTIGSDTQALFFPASDVIDRYGREVDDDIIPKDVIAAVCEEIYWLLEIDSTIDPVITASGIDSADAGVKVSVNLKALPDRLAPMAIEIVSDYGEVSGAATNGGFKIVNAWRG